jgi:hypothetical protein
MLNYPSLNPLSQHIILLVTHLILKRAFINIDRKSSPIKVSLYTAIIYFIAQQLHFVHVTIHKH